MSEEENRCEVSVVLLGTAQKTIFFDKLCLAASSYERHVHYDDVYYLTVADGDKKRTVQITDPGLARTGGREMAIRKAAVALLYYSAHSSAALEQLRTVKDDLFRKGGLPMKLICDTDDVILDEDDGSTGISSQSEGYESDPERNPRRRRPSMDKMRRVTEDIGVNMQAGRDFCTELGDSCEFIEISSSKYNSASDLLMEMIQLSKAKKRVRSRSLNPLRIASKSREGSAKTESTKSKGSNSDSQEENKPPQRKTSEVKNSKVCVIS